MRRSNRRWARAAALAAVSWLGGSAAAAQLVVEVRDGHGRPLANAVVTATAIGRELPAPAVRPTAVIDQIDKEFVPRVSAIRVGTAVRFPNKDDIRHHVYSFSPAKTFELPLYKGTPADPVVFDKPGLVILGCNIHDWMVAYVYVVDTPYFAVTGRDGRAVLKDLPDGDWQVTARHPLGRRPDDPPTQRWSGVGPPTLSLAIDVRPDVRRSRASAAAAGDYP